MPLLKDIRTRDDIVIGVLEDNTTVPLHPKHTLYGMVVHFSYRLPPRDNKESKTTILIEAQNKARKDGHYYYQIFGEVVRDVSDVFESAVAVVPCHRYERIEKDKKEAFK